MASPSEVESLAALYRRGGFGYGDVKKLLADAAEAFFAKAWERRAKYESDAGQVEAILKAGAERAREVASRVLSRAEQACGLGRHRLGPPNRK
jgi:tryptophanyl-tRNA synthetase